MGTDIKTVAIGTLTIALLISLGFNVPVADTHFCRSKELSMKCDRLSSTLKTCYPTPNTRLGSKLCSEGWEEVFAEEAVIPEPVNNSQFELEGNNKEWHCEPPLIEAQPLKCFNEDKTRWAYANCVVGDEMQ